MRSETRGLLVQLLQDMTRLRRSAGWVLDVQASAISSAPLFEWDEEAQAYGAVTGCGQRVPAEDVARLLR